MLLQYSSGCRSVPLPRSPFQAFIDSDPSHSVSVGLTLSDVSEVKLTYFSQCHYSVHLAENSPGHTRVTKFVIKGAVSLPLVWKGRRWTGWTC